MNKDAIFAGLQRFGSSMMVALTMLPAAGLLLGLGMALQNPQLVSMVPSLENEFWSTVSAIFIGTGNAVFANIAVIFAVGVAVGLADDGTAGLAGLVGYFMMNTTINVALKITPEMVAEQSSRYSSVLGINTLQTGAFGGILIGFVAYLMYKRYHKIELPQYLGFFQAKRFVPIATAAASIVVGFILSIVWPYVQTGVIEFMSQVLNSNNPNIFAVFLYGTLFKFTGLFGLHHLVYPVYYYQLGSYTTLAGKVIHGDQAIYFAQLADKVDVTAGASMGGSFIIYIFGLLGVAYAIYKTSKPQNRKAVGGMLIAAIMTSSITGITEPLEFAFAFVAFPLYVIHAIFTGIAYAIVPALGIHVGTSFSGGLIDFVLCSILPNAPKWWLIPPLGILFAAVYYLVFSLLIVKFDFKTPGRVEGTVATDGSSTDKKTDISKEEVPLEIIKGLGGAENIDTLASCFTRLRVTVFDNTKVVDDIFYKLGASNVFKSGSGVQIVFGTKSQVLKDKIKEIIA
jgi:PTS system D-glucosamine-specific IIC component